MKKAWAYILPTLLCFVLGGLVGWWQNDAIREWYPHLVKPALTPPNAAFPIAWSIIYCFNLGFCEFACGILLWFVNHRDIGAYRHTGDRCAHHRWHKAKPQSR